MRGVWCQSCASPPVVVVRRRNPVFTRAGHTPGLARCRSLLRSTGHLIIPDPGPPYHPPAAADCGLRISNSRADGRPPSQRRFGARGAPCASSIRASTVLRRVRLMRVCRGCRRSFGWRWRCRPCRLFRSGACSGRARRPPGRAGRCRGSAALCGTYRVGPWESCA